ncbi:MAG: transposase [Anaerolineaceae bacterium]
MPSYVRNQIFGGTYFFTLVTHNRQKIFSDSAAVDILVKAIRDTQKRIQFDLIAYCILFDHVHLLISLPIDHRSFSQIIRNVKRITTKHIRELLGKPELTIWQARFWEHTIRDEEDLKHHFDYIHYNPVKHGYVEDYGNWAWSSFSEYFDNDSSIYKIEATKFEDENRSYGE